VKGFPRVPESIGRVLIVFVLLAGGVLAARMLIPPSMKDSTFHRQEATSREMARPVRHAGSATCADCHDEFHVKEAGYHASLSCETCHGAAREHSENPLEAKPTLPRMREFCSRCHTYDPSRPTGFPQINPAVHNPLKQCIACHNPHDPKPPTVPQACQACHAEIARTKAVSPHVLLECTTCHVVPAPHKVTPRAVKATIPSDRAFCGKCHGTQSSNREAPKVDLAIHGEKYLCWQCHYPHMPELD